MSQSLREMIDACMTSSVLENNEFALHGGGEDETWAAQIDNPVPWLVLLGESEGKYQGYGATPEEAVAALLVALKQAESKK